MGNEQFNGMLAPLPEGRSRWKLFISSFGAQSVVVVLLCYVGLLAPPAVLSPEQYRMTALVAPPIEDFTTPPPKELMVKPVAPSLVTPKLELPRTEVMRVPPPPQRERPVPAPEMRAMAVAAAPTVTIQPKATPVVHTGGFGAEPTVRAGLHPPQQVQTGGFGDPNGSRAEGVARPKLPQMRTGSFDLPPGPGYGNGTGGAQGVRGAVANAGFGAAAAAPASQPRTSGTVQAGGFGDARAVAPAPRPSVAPIKAAVVTPVEIISKPKPIYTDEARRLKIEGEVLLQARFRANGELEVLGITRGLGHGLDEAAMRAAQQIRFRPAKQDGVPVDSIASLHVLFQLAF